MKLVTIDDVYDYYYKVRSKVYKYKRDLYFDWDWYHIYSNNFGDFCDIIKSHGYKII